MSRRAVVLRLAAGAVLGMGLAACDGDDSVQIRPRVITIVSGDAQMGKAGRELADSLAVRVTDDRGRALPGVRVHWSVASGRGFFNDAPEQGYDYFDCSHAGTTFSMSTDQDGVVRVAFTPTSFGPAIVTAHTAIPFSPVTFTTDASDPGARIAMVSGDRQVGKAGAFEWLDWLGVRVVDGDGHPVPYVQVVWSVTSGGGRVTSTCLGSDPTTAIGITFGDEEGIGLSLAEVRLTTYGTSTVVASLPGVATSPVLFTAEATALVIGLAFDPWLGETFFFAPDFEAEATLPLGATVELWSREPEAVITATTVPPGGTPFEGVELAEDERFQFVVDAAGTWELVDEVSGATATLVVQ
jgi:protocatechuate 3,4-dioxygenase beta subunit